jgi:uncharacterized protein with FMN-binding domain
MKKMHIVLIVILAVLIIGAAGGVMAYNSINSNLEKLSDMPVSDVELKKIADGAYSGTYSAFPVSVEVKVTVKDHAITMIQIVKHDNGQGAPAEVLPEQVIKAQSLQVDTISGATYSSKCILKAIENALESGVK